MIPRLHGAGRVPRHLAALLGPADNRAPGATPSPIPPNHPCPWSTCSGSSRPARRH